MLYLIHPPSPFLDWPAPLSRAEQAVRQVCETCCKRAVQPGLGHAERVEASKARGLVADQKCGHGQNYLTIAWAGLEKLYDRQEIEGWAKLA